MSQESRRGDGPVQRSWSDGHEPPEIRGVARSGSERSRRNRRLGEEFDLLVVGPSGNGGIRQYIDGQVSRLTYPVTIHDTNSPPSGSGVAWFARAVLMGIGAMIRFAVREKPDLVHVHTSHRYSFYRASFYVLFAKYAWGVPVVLHVHGSSFDEFVTEASPPVAALQHVVFDASDRTIVLSSYWRDVLARRADEASFRVVPNAVDPAAFPLDDDEGEHESEDGDGDGDSEGDPHVVFVSNLVERKGVRELVAALDSLHEGTGGEFRATIAGDGPLSHEVEALADRRDGVTYLGYVSEERKRSLLAEGSIFVLPTYAEGLPIAMLEGMAGANAVVSTAVGSIPEVIDDDRGILVPPGDIKELEAAIRELVSSPGRRREMADLNRRTIEEEYSWDAVIDELLDIYREVTSTSNESRRETAEVHHAG